jgi:O2-independent ubiquinone biosynthesis accessory factor UbiT
MEPGMTTRQLAVALAGRMRPLLSRLPQHPPAFALASALNRLLLHRLPVDARQVLSNRPVLVAVTDVGMRLRLQLGDRGFEVASRDMPVVLRISAEAGTYWRLLSGVDDADRLFFERLLVMEGDTEMGLVLKNTLDAIGPLWR